MFEDDPFEDDGNLSPFYDGFEGFLGNESSSSLSYSESSDEKSSVLSTTSSSTGDTDFSFDDIMNDIFDDDHDTFDDHEHPMTPLDPPLEEEEEEEAQKMMMLPEMPSPQRVVEFLGNPVGSSGHLYDVPCPSESSSLFGASGVLRKIDALAVFEGTDFTEQVNRKLLSVAIGGDLNMEETAFCTTAVRMFGLLTSKKYENETSDIFPYQREEGLLFGMKSMKSGSNRRGPKLDIVMKIVEENKRPRYIKPLLARKNAQIGWFVCYLFKKFLETKIRMESQDAHTTTTITTTTMKKKRKKKKKKKKRKKMKFTDFKVLMTYYFEAFEILLGECPYLHENLKKNVEDELFNSLKIFKSPHFKSPQMNGCLLNYLFCHEYQKIGEFFHDFRRSITVNVENKFDICQFRGFVKGYENVEVIDHFYDYFLENPETSILNLVKIAHGFFVVKVKEYGKINREMMKILDEKRRMMKKKRKREYLEEEEEVGIFFFDSFDEEDGFDSINIREKKRRRFV